LRAVGRATVDDAGLARWVEPWDGLVHEALDGDAVGGHAFVAVSGPFRSYRRTVEVTPAADGRHEVTSTAEFRLAIPYFNWLLALPVRNALRKPRAALPWWGPADRLDARASNALGALCFASLVAGYLGTSITQTITFASDDFGLHGDRPQTVALAVTRLAVFLAIGLVTLADHRGRRKLLLVSAVGACLFAGTTALAPSLPWFTASQTVARGFSTALAVLIAVVAAEEMPAGARAWGVSVLGMSAALGAGLCVMALPLADVNEGGWRLLFLVPLLALPLLRDLARRLPESKRFTAAHAVTRIAGHGNRLALLAASAFLLQVFTAPASQLQNEFLRDERSYTAFGISLFTICTSTPAGIGVVAGGKLADVHGRRIVGAVGVIGGVGGTVLMFLSHGPAMWAWSLGASVIGGASLPALGVYGPELFPTGVRAKANGVLVVAGVLGSSAGLLAAGTLSDSLGSLGRALAVLAIGPALLAILVLARYPETARLELEDLNPEDRATTS
jgi:MFS family permease